MAMTVEEKMHRPAMATESTPMHPLIKERLHRPRSIFSPGHRIRMNVVPMFLNVFAPWGIFVWCCGITSFWTMYANPLVVYVCLAVVGTIWAAAVVIATWARRHDPDPSWFTYAAIIVGIAALGGTMGGMNTFNAFSKPYYEIMDMKVVKDLDASSTPGQNVMDAGIFEFLEGNRFDAAKSWHFKRGTLYCVAPIISNTSTPLRQSYDFWAVGKDCCSESSSDFRCGSWGSAQAKGGIRVTSDGDSTMYRLAVEQAISLYDVMAPNPIFLEWSTDPHAQVESWRQQGWKNYLVMVGFAFICSCFFVTLAACRFAWIGRAASAYETDFYNDASWKAGGYMTPMDYGVKSYTA